jgi:hypothetical protein
MPSTSIVTPGPVEAAMPEPAYPYATHLDIKFPQLSVVDVPALIEACTDHRTRAPDRPVILMVENAGIVPTGDA